MIYINKTYIDFLDKNNEQYHRLNGPAYINAYINGDYQAWYQNGEYHRIGGPAIIYKNNEYWLKGKQYTECDYVNILKTYT